GSEGLFRFANQPAEFLNTACPGGGEFLGLLRVRLREVVAFTTVFGEIVQFPRPVGSGGDEFPVPLSQRTVADVRPPEVLARDGAVLRQCWKETAAGGGRDRLAVPSGGLLY